MMDLPELPQLLIDLLERDHLRAFNPSLHLLTAGPDDANRPILHEIRRLARPAAGVTPNRLFAHVLTAVHAQGHAVVMTAHGDGERHRIGIGCRRMPGQATGSTGDFLDSLAGLLHAHLPGLALDEPRPHGPETTRFIQAEATAFAVMTGVPSLRPGADGLGLQNLDRFLTAMTGRRYVLQIVAEPLGHASLNQALHRCRTLKSEVHGLIRRNVSGSYQTGSGTSTAVEQPSAEPQTQLLRALVDAADLPPFTRMVLRSHSSLQTTRTTTTENTTTGVTVGGSLDLLDARAEACEQLLQVHIERLSLARAVGWWRTTIQLCAEDDAALAVAAAALRGIGAGQHTALDPLRCLPLLPAQARAAMLRGQTLFTHRGSHPLGSDHDVLGTCMNSDELAVLMNLPEREAPGVLLREVGEFAQSVLPPTSDTVRLGRVRDSQGRALQPITLSEEALNRHVFISGMTGYGKSTTARRLLVEANTELGVPFLVIEPAKAEYRALASHPTLRHKLRVYGIGPDAPLPLRLNPFTPVGRVPLFRHVDLLKAVFNASFPMFAGMSYVLEEAIIQVYVERGWNLYDSSNKLLGRRPSRDDLSAVTPTLSDLYNKIEQVLEERRYAPEIHQNLGAALRSRLRSLMIGSKGLALNTARSTPPAELFDTPCVVELRNLGDDEEKSFVMALLLCNLYEYAESRQLDLPTHARDRLHHLTLVEEAHRLLRAARPPSEAETPDAQAKAVALFTDMLAELRAYGEGFIVADQIPTKLTPETIKNSNVKILHRLPAADDRAVLAGATNLTEEQSRQLATLSPGEAVFHDERTGSAVLIGVEPLVWSLEDVSPALSRGEHYLRRNGGCRHCTSPCDFLSHAEPATAETDRELTPFFARLLIDEYEVLANRWVAWRHGAGPGGVAYCSFVQAGYRWLTSLMSEAHPSPHLAADRAARYLADFCRDWLTEPTATALESLRETLGPLIAGGVPPSFQGCDTCPARCKIWPLLRPEMTRLANDAQAAATYTSTVSLRIRRLRDLALPQIASDLEAPLLYCLVVQASASGGIQPPNDILIELAARADGTGPGSSPTAP